jgi:hypothetical protein
MLLEDPGGHPGEKISVRCPWADQHSTDSETTVLFRNDKRPGGYAFTCKHSHCAHRKVDDVYSFMGYVEPQRIGGVVSDDTILIRGGDLHNIVDAAESALAASSVIRIYQRGGKLVRAIKVDQPKADDIIIRQTGSTILTAVSDAWLVEQMGRVRPWMKILGKRRVMIDPPRVYAETLRQRGEWKFPVLTGIVTAPTLTKEGRVLDTPGYDQESGILLDYPLGLFPEFPKNLTKDHAVSALSYLIAPLREFLFVSGAKSVALSAILTALIRPSLHSAPLHAYDAPVAGSGKSLLAEMVGLIATGVRPPALSQGKTEEEDEKRLASVLFAGDAIVHLDNVERPLSGDFLCTMLTQPTVQSRILGQSEMRTFPALSTILASGNNLSYAGDMSRRVVPCRLDPKTEHPEQRVCSFNCHEEVKRNRVQLVMAGLIILKAYQVAGFPEHVRSKGSFEDWDWIRGALIWVGEDDPEAQCAQVFDADPRRDELVSVMELWDAAYGNSRRTVASIETRAETDEEAHRHTHDTALRDKLVEVCCRGKWSGKSVGWWLKRHKDRIVKGRCYRQVIEGARTQWMLEGGRRVVDEREDSVDSVDEPDNLLSMPEPVGHDVEDM